MKILGIDPGYGRCGWGIISVTGNRLAVEANGVIETSATEPFPKRLMHIHEQLNGIILGYEPDEAAIEELFFTKNVKTGIDVGQARGVLVLTCSQHGLPIAEYKPVEIKIAVTGSGAAVKSQMQRMVKLLLNLKTVPKPDDVADALAIAICHAHSRTQSLIG